MESATPKREKRLSPKLVAVIAFLITIGLGICSIAAIMLLPAPEAAGETAGAIATFVSVIQNGTCPAAIVVAVLAYFVAKGRQGR